MKPAWVLPKSSVRKMRMHASRIKPPMTTHSFVLMTGVVNPPIKLM
jgi:hypothetical protein